MDSSVKIDWEKLISVDESWVVDQLVEQQTQADGILTMRAYTIKYKSANYSTKELVEFIKKSVTNYSLPQGYIEQLENRKKDPLTLALEYFGKVNPQNDGKFGELILYLLVEAILKTPMVVFKIPSSPNDQVKGADGFFLGDYKDQPAILIGEAKTWGSFTGALSSAFDSLLKFYEEKEGKDKWNYEYLVAANSIRNERGFSEEELDYLYACFIQDSDENAERIKVHPVLIIYDNSCFSSIKADSIEENEVLLKDVIQKTVKEKFNKIEEKSNADKHFTNVYLDFFLLPVLSVDQFRKDLYKSIHGEEFQVKKTTKRKAKS